MKKDPKTATDPLAAIAFIKKRFDDKFEGGKISLEVCANHDGSGENVRHSQAWFTGTYGMEEWIKKHDRPGGGVYLRVNAMRFDARTYGRSDVAWLMGIYADVDVGKLEIPTRRGEKDVDVVQSALKRLEPTALVWSGRGFHAYFDLAEPLPATPENVEKLEAMGKRLADYLAGDNVSDVARLLRLPGTHNTKDFGWTLVECEFYNGPAYRLEQLEQRWGATAPQKKPLFVRRAVSSPAADNGRVGGSSGGSPGASQNPFLDAAKTYGYTPPPIDIDEVLAGMDAWIPGGGDDKIHDARRRVAMSMAQAGATLEEVIAKIVPRILAIGAKYGLRWADKDERRLVKRDYNSALRKPDVAERAQRNRKARQEESAAAPPPGAGSSSQPPGEAPKQPKDKPPKRRELHIPLALHVLDAIASRGERILIHPTGTYWYLDNLWQLQEERELKNRLHREIEIAAKADKIPTDRSLRNETREWILARPEIYQPEVEFDAHGKVPVINGLIDPRTGKIDPPKPEHYATWRIEQAYDPKALCPILDDMVAHVFGDRDPDVFAVIRQIFFELVGVGLIDKKGKALSRALLLEGGTDTGKSQLLRVIGAFYGKTNATTIASLDGTHGLMQFVHRNPWILDEAADEGDWHKSSIVKSIISGDPISINIKNGLIITKPFTAPIFWGTNTLPQFKEITRAIAERMVLLQCRNTFDKNKPIGPALIARERGYLEPADLVIDTEMPGVLAAAVEGLKRAMMRGFFVIPEESVQLMAELHEVSNIAIAFRNDCLRYNPAKMMSCADMFAMFSGHYAREFDIDAIPSQTRFGLAMKGLGDPRILIDRKLRGTNGRRYYGCVEPTFYGIECWKSALEAEHFNLGAKKFPGASDVSDGVPAVPLLGGWGDKPAVKRAQKLWEQEQEKDPQENVSGSKNERVKRVTNPDEKGSHDTSPTRFEETRHDEKPLGHKRPRF